MTRATILHVDLDAFFAAVEQRDRPELRGKPVVVGGGGPNDRGVVSAASYEARRYGIRSAMPLRTAAALCPEAVFLPVDGRRYEAASRQVMAILRGYTPRVEPLSIDEAFLDVAGSEALFGSPERIAGRIKSDVRVEVGLTASVGVASSKLVAKIASELRKPDGLVVVAAGEEAGFLAPLAIERLWGVGPAARRVLADYGVRTIGDLADVSEDQLVRRFGEHGGALLARARGIDPSPVSDPGDPKSISHEHTFALDTDDRAVIERTLLGLAEGVATRLRAAHLRARTVGVKIRYADFSTITRQRTRRDATDQTELIWSIACELSRREPRRSRVRLLGIFTAHFSEADQLALFDAQDDRRRRAIVAVDAVRSRFGRRALTRAALLEAPVPEPFERDSLTAPERR